ncbi:hypothetical protein VE25_18630 [Devosia geojensis]|uniref:Uncharacterized protein n=1 Tax=Devosia geojensis TaxID=443610 RepID=A0A0F5FK02_9HYPH|nr:hypothetical protein [Devosia geojensis]KKB08527.1 hypothetical protein VE25_18630 [Devosia geojensis]
MAGQFDTAGRAIPVTVIGPGEAMPLPGPGVAVLRLEPETGHAHANGDYCPACEARSDVRAQLFDLLEGARQGLRPAFRSVLLDARALADVEPVVAALEGRLPARAMRDHTVGRRFRVAGVTA